MISPPTLDQFLACPAAEVARVAPATAIFAAGGTRRSAVLRGISPQSDDYAGLLRAQMVACFGQFFSLGVSHLFTSVLRPGQLDEVGPYRERLMRWIDWGVAGPEALADYRRLGWRVRLVGAADLPDLRPAAERLSAATPACAGPTLWLYAAPDRGSIWHQLLAAAQAARAGTQAELIRALLGEDVPPAGLQVGFGKPLVTNDIIPLVLYEETQCYWVQRPGYDLDEVMLRRILYDRAYLRPTWVSDKSSRYADVSLHRALWESPTVLGIGSRIGGFWYPDLSQKDHP